MWGMSSWDDPHEPCVSHDNRAVIARFKNKLLEVERERAAQELAHNQSSDYHTPPSLRVATIEGEVKMLKWVIETLEKT